MISGMRSMKFNDYMTLLCGGRVEAVGAVLEEYGLSRDDLKTLREGCVLPKTELVL